MRNLLLILFLFENIARQSKVAAAVTGDEASAKELEKSSLTQTTDSAEVVTEEKKNELPADSKTADPMDTNGDANKSDDDKPADDKPAAANDKEEAVEKEKEKEKEEVLHAVVLGYLTGINCYV
jgi:uncharacterized glyoxalase superfamily metalloenzyme YdcJ